MTSTRASTCCVLLLAALSAAGCSSSTTTTPTDPTPQSGSATDFFTGTLSPGGSQFYTLPVQQALNVKVTLASVTRGGVPIAPSLRLVFGTSSDGQTCTGTNTVTVTPALTAHVDVNVPAASYCITLSDPDSTLTGDVDFAVRIKQTLGTPVDGLAGTDNFSTNVYPGGTATRTFTVGATSDVRITLTQVQPAASLGFGVGISKDLSECRFVRTTVSTSGSPQEMTVRADPGAYCVRVFDPGTLTQRVTFFMNIVHQ